MIEHVEIRYGQGIDQPLGNNMFELANKLIGIYKIENCMKSVTIDPSSFTVKGTDS